MINNNDPHQQPKSSSRSRLRPIGPFMPLIFMLGFAGCASPGVTRMPPVSQTPTHSHRIGKFVWHDLLTTDLAYRNVYGPGFRDWDPGRSYPDRPLLERGIAVPESGEEASGKRQTRVPIENAGRPEPPRSRIPGISELPEIPDEPTVLPE